MARNYIGTEHQAFVTFRDLEGGLIVGEMVHLDIAEGPHVGLTLDVQTDENGQGTFSYTVQREGTDIIHVWTGAESFEKTPEGMSAEVANEWC